MYIKSWYLPVFLLLSINVYSQQKEEFDFKYKVNYKMTYQTDSTDEGSVKQRDMELLLNDSVSLFRSVEKGVYDSLAYEDNTYASRKLLRTPIKYQILKKGNSIITEDSYEYMAPKKLFYIESKEDLKWDLQPDTVTISNFLCHSAKVRFGDRTWSVWYTLEIPIMDGPYKFCGLPGLILSAQDEKGYWRFDLDGIENRDRRIAINFIGENNYRVLTKREFLKAKRYYVDNFVDILLARDLLILTEQQKRNQYKIQKIRGQKDNNWIEPYKP